MKKILFPFCLLLSFVIYGQIPIKVKQSFPAHITYKIKDIATKIKLTEEQQMQIGKRLVKKDSLANVHIRRTDTLINLKDYYTVDKAVLVSILSQEELDDYLSQADDKNRFLLAIKSAKKLQLNPKQVEEIRSQNVFLTSKTQLSNKQKNIFYVRKLDSILEKKQYGALLRIIYSKESALKTQKDWNAILKLKLATPQDSIALYSKIGEYHLISNIMQDPKSGIYGPNKINTIRDKVNLQFQPQILVRYNIVTEGIYKKNIFSEILKYDAPLKLTTNQIDSLLAHYKKIEQLKFKNNELNLTQDKSNSYTIIENKATLETLDAKQLQLFLMLRNQKKAVALAHNNWKSLEKLGLTKEVDKDTTLKEFTSYELKSLASDNLVKIDNNQINVFYRRDILLKKPALLKQLDEINQTNEIAKKTKNNLKW
jgi:hypothetical protein